MNTKNKKDRFSKMAANTGANKRIPIKHIRDRAKSAYEKKAECHICGTTMELELHHIQSLTLLLDRWVLAKGYDISTDEKVLEIRDEFIEDHYDELYNQVFTLCNRHHVKLHSIFGKAPTLISGPKQIRWVEIQKAKALGIEPMVEGSPKSTPKAGAFSKFY